uniref:Uncharacterized protein n=1 Tax=Ciona savignyi TaxID=51511 RepID=H2YXW8_CIOSA
MQTTTVLFAKIPEITQSNATDTQMSNKSMKVAMETSLNLSITHRPINQPQFNLCITLHQPQCRWFQSQQTILLYQRHQTKKNSIQK